MMDGVRELVWGQRSPGKSGSHRSMNYSGNLCGVSVLTGHLEAIEVIGPYRAL
jgi:hypothetical protein